MIKRKILISTLVILIACTGAAKAEEMLTWEDCVKEARKSHPDLVSAWEKLKQAKASKEITRSAVLPQITGNASRTTSQSPSGGAPNGMVSATSVNRKPSTTYEYDITGQQLLFDGFKTSYDLSTAARNIVAARYNYDVTSSNVRLRLRTAFVNLLNAQELLEVAKDIEARRKQSLELVRSLYNSGREHKGSLLTSEADLAQATYQVSQAKRNIYLSQRQLIKELGRRIFSPIVAKGDMEVKDRDKDRPDFERLAETNPFLQQLIAQKEAARFGVKSAYAQFFPQVFANASEGNINTRWPADKNEWSIGASISLPIFDGGNRFATAAKAEALLDQTEADERSGRDGVIFTLSNMWTQLQDAVDNIEVQKKSLDAARERAKIAEAEYSIGLMTFDNWIIIEDGYVNAKTNFLNTETNALTAEANWIQAKGGTLDYD